MITSRHETGVRDELAQIRSLAHPLARRGDLGGLVETIGDARFVCLGEASHGTHDFYTWRAELSRRLIAEKDFTWIGVEGDWPDCWRIDRWVRGQENQSLSAQELSWRTRATPSASSRRWSSAARPTCPCWDGRPHPTRPDPPPSPSARRAGA